MDVLNSNAVTVAGCNISKSDILISVFHRKIQIIWLDVISTQHQETSVQILPNAYIKKWSLKYFLCKCCYINTENVTNWFACTIKGSLTQSSSNIFILKSIISSNSLLTNRVEDRTKVICINNRKNLLYVTSIFHIKVAHCLDYATVQIGEMSLKLLEYHSVQNICFL